MSVSDARLGASPAITESQGRARMSVLGTSQSPVANWVLAEESDSLMRIADRHVIENAEVGEVKFRHIH